MQTHARPTTSSRSIERISGPARAKVDLRDDLGPLGHHRHNRGRPARHPAKQINQILAHGSPAMPRSLAHNRQDAVLCEVLNDSVDVAARERSDLTLNNRRSQRLIRIGH
jgi:hypothetical protein